MCGRSPAGRHDAGIHAVLFGQPTQVRPQRVVGLASAGGDIIGMQAVNMGSVHAFGLDQSQQVRA